MKIRKNKFSAIYLAVSLFLAVFLWFYVMGVKDPTMDKTFTGIEISIVGEDTLYKTNGFTLMGVEQSTVSVTLSGRRSDILKVKAENINVEADLSTINAAGLNYIQCSVIPPDTALTVENLSNVRVAVDVDSLVSIDIPVKLVYDAKIADNEIFGTSSVSPEVITVNGAQSELSNVAYALVTVEDSKLTESYYKELEYTFVDHDGNPVELKYATTITDKVQVSIPVLMTKTIDLETHIIEGGGLTAANVNVQISPQVITIAGEKSVIESMDSLIIKDINLEDIGKSTTSLETIKLDEGLVNVSQITSASVKITLVNASERTMIIPAANMKILNAPEGFNIAIKESSVQLTLWGGNSVVSAIKNSNVILFIDLNGFTDVGTYDVPITVSFQDLDVVPKVEGNYSVHVEITKPK